MQLDYKKKEKKKETTISTEQTTPHTGAFGAKPTTCPDMSIRGLAFVVAGITVLEDVFLW
jgi:hypothetical protein